MLYLFIDIQHIHSIKKNKLMLCPITFAIKFKFASFISHYYKIIKFPILKRYFNICTLQFLEINEGNLNLILWSKLRTSRNK